MISAGRGSRPVGASRSSRGSARTAGPAARDGAGGGPGVQVEERVRWSDVDAAGILCYGAYLRFYEIAETELFRAAGEPYHEVFERYDVWLPRVHVEADFVRPAFLDDLLRVRAAVDRIGSTSLRLSFRVEREGDLLARARFVMVCVRRSDFSKTPLPAELAAGLARLSGGRSPRRSRGSRSGRSENRPRR